MKSKQEIKREYRERQKPAGVFQIKNTVNGKVLLGSSFNLEGPLNSHKFMLSIGKHRNEILQKEWDEYGADKFIFEILEVVKVKEDLYFHRQALEELEGKVVQFLRENKEMAPPQFKDLSQVSRKFAIPLLEHFDGKKLTMRIGDKRVLRK